MQNLLLQSVAASEYVDVRRTEVEPKHDAGSNDQKSTVDAFYLLTLPLTVGPGSMSVAIALGAQRAPSRRQNCG